VSGNNSLHAVVYVSRATRVQHAAEADCIAQILAVSARNNAASAVTGALLACDGWFCQVLEGRRIDVEHTLRRIERDPDHTQIRRLSARPIAVRNFPDWNMCASVFTSTDEQIVQALAGSGRFDPTSLSAASAMRLLLTVARLQGRMVATERAPPAVS
jgi:hypothetical protein